MERPEPSTNLLSAQNTSIATLLMSGKKKVPSMEISYLLSEGRKDKNLLNYPQIANMGKSSLTI